MNNAQLHKQDKGSNSVPNSIIAQSDASFPSWPGTVRMVVYSKDEDCRNCDVQISKSNFHCVLHCFTVENIQVRAWMGKNALSFFAVPISKNLDHLSGVTFEMSSYPHCGAKLYSFGKSSLKNAA